MWQKRKRNTEKKRLKFELRLRNHEQAYAIKKGQNNRTPDKPIIVSNLEQIWN